MKTFLISLIIFVVLILMLWFKFSHDMPDLSPQIKMKMIRNPITHKYVYLKNITSGLNYSVNILSLDSTKTLSKKDFAFDSDIIYYKYNYDTLCIITMSPFKSPVGSIFPSPVKCELITDNVDYLKFKKEYSYKGYYIFPTN